MLAPLAVAVVGAGRWGANLIATLARLPEFELRAVCDLRPVFAPAPCFSDLEQLLSEVPLEVLVIATPAESHAQLVVRALEAGKHVFVEKPMCSSSREVRAIERALSRSGKRLMVGHLLAYHPALAVLERELGARAGEPRPWRARAWRSSLAGADPGRCPWWTLGVHDVVVFSRVFGFPERLRVQRRLDGSVRAELEFVDGSRAELELHTRAAEKVRRLAIGTAREEWIFDDLAEHRLVRSDAAGQVPIPVPDELALDAELRHFARAVLEGEPIRSDFHEGARVVAVLEQGQRSLDAGGIWIEREPGASARVEELVAGMPA